MMWRLALLALLGSCGDNRGPCTDHSAPPTPVPCPSGTCVDVHVVAHEDDDLLFMNPDIAGELAGGHRVVVIYVTAGELDDPAHESYWHAREQGMRDAYAYMLHGATWNVSPDAIAGLSFATDRAGPVTLVFLRLGDLQTQCLWEDANGCSDIDAHPVAPPYLAATKACTLCTPQVATQQITRSQLIDVLAQLMTREGATRVATLDSTALHFDALGVASNGYTEYWDHYFTGLFATAAAARAGVPQLASYRAYTVSHSPPNLDLNQACSKLDVFAHYATDDPAIVPAAKHDRFASCPSCFWHDAYGVTASESWQTRELVSSSLVTPAHFALRSGDACITSSLALGDCANAAVFSLDAGRVTTTGGCVAVASPGHIDTPVPQCNGTPCPPVPSTYPPDPVQLGACSTLYLLDNGQIRTPEARCLTASNGAVTSDDCHAETANGHVSDRPVAEQTWRVESR
ncbi:MAG: PIG-L family deacetylase [Deltaproteobacteria bacterium]|nr:PIG-L family deacetylase [Deltaproteobacteria bacterium]